MAFSTNGNQLMGRRRFRHGTLLADINIVPLVDVVLVLLIIFMLTAHVMEFGLEVDVPKVRQVKESTQELPVISLTKDGRLYLNEEPVNINDLAPAIEKRFGTTQAVYLRADKETIWDPIAQIISVLGEAKLNVSVVTQPMDETERRRR
jgi:biopolymer transport protein ExbD